MITSLNNPKIKEVIKLNNKARARKDAGVFLVEGIRMLREVPFDLLKEVYMTQDFFDKHGDEPVLERLKTYLDRPARLAGDDIFVTLVSDECMQKICDTVTPQGVICVIKRRSYEITDMNAGDGTFILLLENIQDPGNLGTMIRTAEAAGATGVIMSQGTVDVYSPKVVRATMGAIFRVPFFYVPDMCQQIDKIKQLGLSVYAACLDGADWYTEPDYTKRCAILIGNEGNGLSKEAIARADGGIFIPMDGQVESLNASISAAVLMYEVHRQRNS